MRLVASMLALVMLASSAHAEDDLAEAQRLEAALEYEQALKVVEGVIWGGKVADAQHLAELYFFAGRLAGGLDRAEIARQHFARALELRPELTLPPGTSPKLTGPFELARAQARPLRVQAIAQQDGSVKLVIDQYPFFVVGRIAFQLADGTLQPTSQIHDAVPPPGALAIVALDKYGNHVWSGAIPPKPPPLDFPHHHVLARTGTWAAISLTGLVGGVLCAWRFQVAQDDWDQASQAGTHDYSELHAIETRGRRWGLAANVGFAVAAGAGITTTILFFAHRDEHRRDARIEIGPGMVTFARDF